MYYSDYDTEPIGGTNPYYRCKDCKVSDPQINGSLLGHHKFCSYRIKKESEEAFKDENFKKYLRK